MIHSTADAFLADIIAHPADDTPRLIYADWLQEHGQAERAELVRLQVKMARLTQQDSTSFRVMQEQCRMLMEWNRDRLAGWSKAPEECVWERGFLKWIVCSTEWWLENEETILALHPLEWIRITNFVVFTFLPRDDKVYVIAPSEEPFAAPRTEREFTVVRSPDLLDGVGLCDPDNGKRVMVMSREDVFGKHSFAWGNMCTVGLDVSNQPPISTPPRFDAPFLGRLAGIEVFLDNSLPRRPGWHWLPGRENQALVCTAEVMKELRRLSTGK